MIGNTLINNNTNDWNLLEKVLKFNPFMNINDIEEFHAINEYDILIKFNNGKEYIYDTLENKNHSVRRINKNDMDSRKKAFVSILRKNMNRRYMDQKKLSEISGINDSTLSRYLNGQSLPGYFNLIKLSNSLKIPVEEFFNEIF